MQSLPSEIKHLIAELSSPSSLAALAQTHTTYQRAAEEALYDTIFISALSDNSLKCMEILATMPEKAGLVRYLTIEYARNNNVKNRSLTTYLSKSLVNMHSLSDFRIRSGPGKVVAQMIKGLGKILWSVCKIVIFFNTYDPAGDTVKVIFDYKLFTAMTISTFLKSLRVKPNCRYLDYIVRETY